MSQSLTRAVTLMLVAMCLIPSGDTAGKLLGAELGADPFYIAWSRFALGAALIAPFAAPVTSLRLLLDWHIWFRALFLVGGICSILTALTTEPIANVFGAFFIGPILAYFLSVLLLREPFSWRRACLLLLGFCGVLLVVRPGFGVTAGMGFALAAGVFYGGYLVASRWLAHLAPPRQMLFTQLVVGAVVLAPLGLTQLPDFTGAIVGLTCLSALGSMLGNLLLISALRLAPASQLTPFVYTQLLSATLLGWWVFGDWPDALGFAGLALILGSGLATLAVKEGR